MKKVGDRNKRLKIIRTNEKLSQAELAELLNKLLKANISQGNIADVERGVRSVPDEWVKALHHHYLIDYAWFYSGTGSRKLTGKEDKTLVTNTAELVAEIELLRAKIEAQERMIGKLWDKVFPEE